MSLGRNDPCHCGSGKKYKKCHLNADLEKARAEKELKTLPQWVAHHGSSLRTSVHEAARSTEGLTAAAQAWFGDAAPDDPLADRHFEQHVLFDIISGDAPLITQANDEGEALDAAKLTLAQAFAASHGSLFEVIECKRYRGIRLADRLLGSERWLPDPDLADILEPMEVIFGRVITYRKENILLGGWRKVVFRTRKAAIKDLQALVAAADLPEDDAASRVKWLKDNAAAVAKRILEAGLQA